ncbi:probable ATP-dependent RNA helicase spindle-E [Anabrus simplex]|uniref:probable ATP-dependent RNA helicase spindle-E n=1 Tax=Anabrus simplex TaxID=316456 RepID=UPI0035A2AE86
MELLDFFDLSKKFERVCVQGSQTQGHIQVSSATFFPDPCTSKGPHKGQEYAKEYQIEEDRLMVEKCERNFEADAADGKTGVGDIEELTSVGTLPNIDEIMSEELTKVYQSYSFETTPNTSLPIAAFKSKIISMIEANQVTVIKGATGCGKTTQVPQYILDSCYERGAPCNIIVTQPRRIAAITVAKRVCAERKWPLGSLVGYQVGLNIKTSEDTRMTFCTTGVLLQKLISMKNMNCYTHVILDEVHERDQETDFALLVVRKLLRSNSNGVKVILMSATFNINRFCNYFSQPLRQGKWVPAPYIDLETGKNKRGQFMIHKYYLCQLESLGELPTIRLDEPGISPLAYQVAVRLIEGFDYLEKQAKKTTRGAVLVFLPGIYEIEELYNLLSNTPGDHKWWIRPLHSTVTTDEQESVFLLPPAGCRKIILSTNIAESSLTVPDIVYVIDFCLTKHLVCDPNTNFSSLQTTWASRTNCIQRAGRSGRVSEGRVYRLVPRSFYESELEEEGMPEILRCPLERVVLQAKLLDMGEPKALLALSLDPPDLTNLENTVLLLKEAGALLLTVNGIPNKYDGDITFMGRVMAKLPVDIHVAKLIVLGHVFSVLEECVIMGAAMSLKSMFSARFQKRLEAYHSKLTWADGSCSDSIAFLNAYQVWRHHKLNGYFTRSTGKGEESWAKSSYIQIRVMREVAALVNDLKLRLKRLNIEESVGQGRVTWNDVQKPLVLKIVIAGAFYPNYFVRGAQGGQVDEKDAVRQLVGRDPYNTVFLQGMPLNQPGILYVKTIKKALEECADEMNVTFDGTCKVYVQFGRTTYKDREDTHNFMANIPGKVSMAVYRAVKLRQLRIPIVLNMISAEQAAKRSKELGLYSSKDDPFKAENQDEEKTISTVPRMMVPVLPSIDMSHLPLKVSHVIDPGHFWAQSTDEDTVSSLKFLFTKLNSEEYSPLGRHPKIGEICIAPYLEGERYFYYRARVDAIYARKNDEPLVQVFFIDYGNTEQVKCSALKSFGRDKEFISEVMSIPPLALECVLSEIQPSLLRNPRGLWTDEAMDEFKRIVLFSDKQFYGRIYSVVHGVISLELIQANEYGLDNPYSVNQYFIKKGFAEPAEESYLSKYNHALREQHDEMEPQQKQVYDQQQLAPSDWVQGPEPEPPSKGECAISVTLKGPFSPLEMKIYNVTQIGIRRAVMVEWSSVNSVLLDTDPQDPHERLMVAACVGQNSQGDRLTLRHTTLMPNIHGLPALISLIFAPTIELRVNDTRSHYTGALCGLGVDPETGHALLPDHDMEITFDTEITLDDILNINRLRFWMTCTLYTDRDSEVPDAGPAEIVKCQNKVKEFLFKLLKEKRKSLELELCPRPFTWNLVPEHFLMTPGEVPENDRGIFRLHWAVQLRQLDQRFVKDMSKHIKKLHAIADGKEPMTEKIECLLCDVELESITALHVHIMTVQHREKERNLNAPV